MIELTSQAFDTRKLEQAGDALPFVLSTALNRVAFEGREASIAEMRKVFDDPTGFTLRGTLVDKATKTAPTAIVYLRPEVSRYLEAQIEGGERNAKALEVGLRKRNLWGRGSIPSDTYFVPTSHYRKGKGGNLTKGRAKAILNETKKRDGKFFLLIDDKDSRPYVYERIRGGKDVRLALIGVKPPQYRERFDFHSTVENAVKKTYARTLETVLDDTLPESGKFR